MAMPRSPSSAGTRNLECDIPVEGFGLADDCGVSKALDSAVTGGAGCIGHSSILPRVKVSKPRSEVIGCPCETFEFASASPTGHVPPAQWRACPKSSYKVFGVCRRQSAGTGASDKNSLEYHREIELPREPVPAA